MRINEHRKKGCDKVMDFEGNPLKLKLYPPLINAMEGVYIAKGGNILEYRAKTNVISKPRSNCLLITLVLRPIQTYGHNRKKEETLPLEIHNEVQEDFITVCKKHLMKE